MPKQTKPKQHVGGQKAQSTRNSGTRRLRSSSGSTRHDRSTRHAQKIQTNDEVHYLCMSLCSRVVATFEHLWMYAGSVCGVCCHKENEALLNMQNMMSDFRKEYHLSRDVQVLLAYAKALDDAYFRVYLVLCTYMRHGKTNAALFCSVPQSTERLIQNIQFPPVKLMKPNRLVWAANVSFAAFVKTFSHVDKKVWRAFDIVCTIITDTTHPNEHCSIYK
jgi:hypothetical protein